jgi:hypothetical protein
MTCREWLRTNGYADIADLIDQAISKMAGRGSKQRRNWWDILSGGTNGKPCVCEGIEFPVLRVAQVRQGTEPTPNAISRIKGEQPPDVIATGRWKAKKVASKIRHLPPKRHSANATRHAKAS